MIRSVDAGERSVHKTNEWLADLDEELGTDDRELAWRVLRTATSVLRRHITAGEIDDVMAQLPSGLREVLLAG